MKNLNIYRIATVCVLIIGVSIRLLHAFQGHSLWVDELHLALNIIDRGFSDLLEPLGNNQGAPPLFLFAIKASSLIFGNNDWALLLPIYLISISAFIAFWVLCRFTLPRYACLFATALFALNPQILTYSFMLKQYIADVLLVITIMLCSWAYYKKPDSLTRVLWLSAIGILAPWFSHASVFVLAGSGSVLFIHVLCAKKFNNLVRLSGAICSWIISFAALYFILLSDLHDNQALADYWQEGYPDYTNGVQGITVWLSNFTSTFMRIGTLPKEMTGILLGAGIYEAIRKRSILTLAMLAIIAFSLLASALGRYPLQDRLMLYMVPMVIMISAQGFAYLSGLLLNKNKTLAIAAISLSLIPIIRQAPAALGNRADFQRLKQSIALVQDNYVAGEQIIATSDAISGIQYYAPLMNLSDADYTVEYIENITGLLLLLQQTESTRTWILWGRDPVLGTPDDYARCYQTLRENGIRFSVYRFKNANVLVSPSFD